MITKADNNVYLEENIKYLSPTSRKHFYSMNYIGSLNVLAGSKGNHMEFDFTVAALFSLAENNSCL